MKEIDCTGLSCPIPLVRTKNALKESPEGVDVLLDTFAAKENVSRFAEASGYNVSVEETEEQDTWKLKIRK